MILKSCSVIIEACISHAHSAVEYNSQAIFPVIDYFSHDLLFWLHKFVGPPLCLQLVSKPYFCQIYPEKQVEQSTSLERKVVFFCVININKQVSKKYLIVKHTSITLSICLQQQQSSWQTTVNIKSLHMYQQSFVIFKILQLVCDCCIFITLFRIFQYICVDYICLTIS